MREPLRVNDQKWPRNSQGWLSIEQRRWRWSCSLQRCNYKKWHESMWRLDICRTSNLRSKEACMNLRPWRCTDTRRSEIDLDYAYVRKCVRDRGSKQKKVNIQRVGATILLTFHEVPLQFPSCCHLWRYILGSGNPGRQWEAVSTVDQYTLTPEPESLNWKGYISHRIMARWRRARFTCLTRVFPLGNRQIGEYALEAYLKSKKEF